MLIQQCSPILFIIIYTCNAKMRPILISSSISQLNANGASLRSFFLAFLRISIWKMTTKLRKKQAFSKWKNSRSNQAHAMTFLLEIFKWNVKGNNVALTISSYASLTAVNASTPINGIAVVTGVNEEICGISCSSSRQRK